MDIKEYHIHGARGCLQRHPWELARLFIVEHLFRRLVPPAGQPALVADIGCGDAFVIRRLAADYPELAFWGIDTALSDEQISLFSQDSTLSQCTFFNRFDFTRRDVSPDIVLLLDVLEHVEHETDLLRQAAGMLSPSGQVLITVPAFGSLFCGHDRWLGHYRRYSKSQLLKVIAEAGLETVSTGYFFSSLIIPRLIGKYVERLRGRRNNRYAGIGQWSPGPLMSALVTRWLILNGRTDLWLAQHNLPHTGLSVYAICRKSV